MPKATSDAKWKWIIGLIIGLSLPLLGFAAGYGALNANAAATEKGVVKLEARVNNHDKELRTQSNHIVEQKTLLIGIDGKLDNLKELITEHKHD